MKKEIRHISDLAGQALISSVVVDNENNRQGWGQFVTPTRARIQIGFMGTAAGVAAICSFFGDDGVPSTVNSTFADYWMDSGYNSQDASRRFAQNPKLSVYAVALSKAEFEDVEGARKRIKKEILNRIVRETGWGDWFISKNDYDGVIRPVPTALMLLALKSLGSTEEINLQQIQAYLEDTCQAKTTPDEVKSLCFFALSYKASSEELKSRYKIFRKLPLFSTEIFNEYANFYELKHPISDGTKWSSEVVTFSPGLSSLASSILYCRTFKGSFVTLKSLKTINEQLISTGGLIPPNNSSRTHLLIYFWLGLVVSTANEVKIRPNRLYSFFYALISPFSTSVFLYKVFPTLLMLGVAMLNIYTAQSSSLIQGIVAFITLTLGAAIGPSLLKRWFSIK